MFDLHKSVSALDIARLADRDPFVGPEEKLNFLYKRGFERSTELGLTHDLECCRRRDPLYERVVLSRELRQAPMDRSIKSALGLSDQEAVHYAHYETNDKPLFHRLVDEIGHKHTGYVLVLLHTAPNRRVSYYMLSRAMRSRASVLEVMEDWDWSNSGTTLHPHEFTGRIACTEYVEDYTSWRPYPYTLIDFPLG